MNIPTSPNEFLIWGFLAGMAFTAVVSFLAIGLYKGEVQSK